MTDAQPPARPSGQDAATIRVESLDDGLVGDVLVDSRTGELLEVATPDVEHIEQSDPAAPPPRQPDAQPAASAPAPKTAATRNHFPTVFAFVEDFLVKVYARPTRAQSSWRWCGQWWRHPEALSRLEALWKAFEVLRRDPGTGASTWWLQHADPCMAALSDPEGTFAGCSDTTHKLPPRLPMQEPPAFLTNPAPTPGAAGH